MKTYNMPLIKKQYMAAWEGDVVDGQENPIWLCDAAFEQATGVPVDAKFATVIISDEAFEGSRPIRFEVVWTPRAGKWRILRLFWSHLPTGAVRRVFTPAARAWLEQYYFTEQPKESVVDAEFHNIQCHTLHIQGLVRDENENL